MTNSLIRTKKNILEHAGNILMMVLVFSAVASYLLTAIISWGSVNLKQAETIAHRELAAEIAESGIDYYRWHLAHAPTDFQDGTTTPGPYVHQFYDKDGNDIGQFILNITAPQVGSTLTTITSTGLVNTDNTVSSIIQSKLAIPSLAKFAVVSNDNLRFGAGTEVFGPVQANGGIHFDGLAHNVVSSAQTSYTDPDTGLNEFGVYTQVSPADPQPPSSVPSRPDVFQAGRQFPVGAVDFTGITASLSQIKTNAQSGGLYFPNSGYLGYHIILKTNDTFDLYQVKSLVSGGGPCKNSANQTGWGTWSIASGGEQFVKNYPFPTNGLIFVEDNVWVEGQINVARLTIAAGTFPSSSTTWKSITVNNNLQYTNFDGRDVLSLIAQNNINVGMYSLDTLTIDGALVAQNGRVGRFYYSNGCSPYNIRTALNLYGMIASNIRYGFAYTDGTGYGTRNLTYDANLLYGPPPSFPLTSTQYQILSWKEIK